MTEISKIKINENELILKDEEARNNFQNYLSLTTGGTVKGDLNLLSKNLNLQFETTTDPGLISFKIRQYGTDSVRLEFIQKVRNSDITETFALPASYPTDTSSTHFILTSKNPITIAQGGTGVTTVANASYFFASPSDTSGTPRWRALTMADFPVILTTKGGTGATSITSAVKNFTNSNLGSNLNDFQYFFGMTSNWGTVGYIGKAKALEALSIVETKSLKTSSTTSSGLSTAGTVTIVKLGKLIQITGDTVYLKQALSGATSRTIFATTEVGSEYLPVVASYTMASSRLASGSVATIGIAKSGAITFANTNTSEWPINRPFSFTLTYIGT